MNFENCFFCKKIIQNNILLPINFEPLKIVRKIKSLCGSEYTLKQPIANYERKEYLCSEEKIKYLKFCDLDNMYPEKFVNFCSKDCIINFLNSNNKNYLLSKTKTILNFV